MKPIQTAVTALALLFVSPSAQAESFISGPPGGCVSDGHFYSSGVFFHHNDSLVMCFDGNWLIKKDETDDIKLQPQDCFYRGLGFAVNDSIDSSRFPELPQKLYCVTKGFWSNTPIQ